jgi:O-methyltransferase domain
MLTTDGADRQELNLLLRGFQISRVLGVIADLGIADKIPTDGHVTVDDLAAACAVQPEPLLRVLRMLAAFKIFHVTTRGSVAHTSRSRLLRTDTPNSLHHAARFWTGPGLGKAWDMIDVAMRGRIPHEAAWNESRFAYLRRHPDEARAFDAFMANMPGNRLAAVAAAYDFSGAKLIADIGGGNGAALPRAAMNSRRFIHPSRKGGLG